MSVGDGASSFIDCSCSSFWIRSSKLSDLIWLTSLLVFDCGVSGRLFGFQHSSESARIGYPHFISGWIPKCTFHWLSSRGFLCSFSARKSLQESGFARAAGEPFYSIYLGAVFPTKVGCSPRSTAHRKVVAQPLCSGPVTAGKKRRR